MAKSLKYYTLPKSKVTIWEKPLKAGGVFYYLYLDQTQVDPTKVEEVVKIIRERLPNSAVMGKKTAKTYQISYSLPNGEKAQGVDETMLEFVDDKLQEFGYDDTKNQAVSTRGKKMIGTYAKPTKTSVDLKVGDKFRHTLGTYIWEIVAIDGDKVIANSDTSTEEFSKKRQEELIEKGDLELIKSNVSTPSRVWKVGDNFYHKSDTKIIFEIQSIIGDDVIVLLPEKKGTVDYKISAVDDFFREGKWVLTQPPVSQAQVPEIKNYQFYVDFENYAKLLVVESVETNKIYFNKPINDKLEYGLLLEKSVFEKKISDGKLKLYVPQGGDEWKRYDYPDSVFRVLTNAKGKVEYAIYDSDGNYVMTDNDDEYTFKNYLLRNSFHLTTPLKSLQTQIKKQQFYISFINGGRLMKITEADENAVVYTENENGKIIVGRVTSTNVFQNRIVDGRYKLYVPKGGDEWKMFTSLSSSFIGSMRILSTSSTEVVLASYDKNGNYENTYTSEIIKFCDELVENGYIISQSGGQVAQPKSEPKTESEQEAEQFSKSKEPKYSEKSKLKKELKDLVELKDLISDLDFEDKVNVSTLITKTQNKINDIISKEVEQKIGDTKIFEELFEQSFTPLQSRYDMKMEKNDLVELVAPNGEMSDLNEDVTNLVNSELFKEWFGDFKTAYFYRNLPDFGGVRVSKVLSEKFEPLVVWHGTGKQFSYFRFDNFPAAYFAVNRKYSDFFAKVHSEDGVGYVLPFFININNPLDLSSFGNEKVIPKDFFDWMYLKTGMTPEQLEINPLMLDSSMPPVPIWVYLRNNPTMLKKLGDMGVYDGIKFYEFNPNVDPNDEAYSTLAYITFDPHQAKLADPDRGQILLASLKSFMLEKGGSV